MLPDLKKVKTDLPELQQFQDSAAEAVKAIRAKELLDGVLIQDVAITSGTAKDIAHGLGRTPRGWALVGKSANANVWEDTAYAYRSRFLRLNASANVTISLWVF